MKLLVKYSILCLLFILNGISSFALKSNSTCIVTNTNDSGPGSLREAINCSNSTTGIDEIVFNISSGTSPYIIKPLTALPEITEGLLIDGTTQSENGVLDIILDGENIGNFFSFKNINTVQIKGLKFINASIALNFERTNDIELTDCEFDLGKSSNYLQITNSDLINIERCNFKNTDDSSPSGIFLYSNKNASVSNCNFENLNSGISMILDSISRISSNHFFSLKGVAVSVTASYKIKVESNEIKGAEVGINLNVLNECILADNLIQDSKKEGLIFLTGSNNVIKENQILNSGKSGISFKANEKNIIENNFIGVDKNFNNWGNGENGIFIPYENGFVQYANTLLEIKGNIIGFNKKNGIQFGSSTNCIIEGNFIGISPTGLNVKNTNDGILIVGNNHIVGGKGKGNTIANNGRYGIYLENGNGISINDNVLIDNGVDNIFFQRYSSKLWPNDSKRNAYVVSKVFSGNDYVLDIWTESGDVNIGLFLSDSDMYNAYEALSYEILEKNDSIWKVRVPISNPDAYFLSTSTSIAGNTSQLGKEYNSYFVVTNTNSSGLGSLHECLLKAEMYPDTNTITFDIPGLGPHYIYRGYGWIYQPVIIDADLNNNDRIILDGSKLDFPDCFVFSGEYAKVRGLEFRKFNNALRTNSGTNQFLDLKIDSSSTGINFIYLLKATVKDVIISNSSSDGIRYSYNSDTTLIENCTIYNSSGSGIVTQQGSKLKIISCKIFNNKNDGITIGSFFQDLEVAKSIITGNDGNGISIVRTTNVNIHDNFIGVDLVDDNYVKRGNKLAGISFLSMSADFKIYSNVIGGNLNEGITFLDRISNVEVFNNYIGTDPSGLDLGNGKDGILVERSDVLIGGIDKGNVIGFNGGNGIKGITASTSSNVKGNFIGVDEAGRNVSNTEWGVNWNGSESVLIGGDVLGESNYIGFNKLGGISISYPNIINNYIGVSSVNTEAGNNGPGILTQYKGIISKNKIGNNSFVGIEAKGPNIQFDHNEVFNNKGGLTIFNEYDGYNNLVFENKFYNNNGDAININGTGTLVTKNLIGTDSLFTDLGNEGVGIRLDSAAKSIISENIIGFGSGNGIEVYNSDQNTISKNILKNNTGNPIDLFLTGIKPGNNSIPAPSFTSYSYSAGALTVSGTAQIGDSVEVFLSDGSVNKNALQYIGTVSAEPSFTIEIPRELFSHTAQNHFVATATDKDGNTSELSTVYTFVISDCQTINFNAGQNISICKDESAQLKSTTSGFSNYTWEPASLLQTNNSADVSTLPLKNTTSFAVSAIADNGCPVSSKVTVYIKSDLDQFVKEINFVGEGKPHLIEEFDGGILAAYSDDEGFKLFKANASGEVLWSKKYPITNIQEVKLGIDGIWLYSKTGNADVTLHKISLDGVNHDRVTLPIANNTHSSMSISNEGGVYLSVGELLIKFDSSINKVWEKKLNMNLSCLLESKDGGLIVSGFVFIQDKIASVNKLYAIVCKLNRNQEVVWSYEKYNNVNAVPKFSVNELSNGNILLQLSIYSHSALSLFNSNGKLINKIINNSSGKPASVFATIDISDNIHCYFSLPYLDNPQEAFEDGPKLSRVTLNGDNLNVQANSVYLDIPIGYFSLYSNNSKFANNAETNPLFFSRDANNSGLIIKTSFTNNSCLPVKSVNIDFRSIISDIEYFPILIPISISNSDLISVSNPTSISSNENTSLELIDKCSFSVSLIEHTLESSSIKLKGLAANDKLVELYSCDADGTINSFNHLGNVSADPDFEFLIPNQSYSAGENNYYIAKISNCDNTAKYSKVYTVSPSICTTTNTNDSGIGSLRAAVDSAHVGACRVIDFGFEQGIINLESPIRDIEVLLQINGEPEIVLNGNGAETAFSVKADGFAISNLEITNFNKGIELKADNGKVTDVVINKVANPVVISGNNNAIGGSCINCQSGTESFPINNGITVTGNNNSIGYTGSPNQIVGPVSKGIEVDGGKNNSVQYNTITGSQKGISLTNAANDNYPAPIDLVGTLNAANQGEIAGKANTGDKIQVFLSTDAGNIASAFVAEVTVVDGTFSINIPEEFIQANQNNYFIITATSAGGNTSEFSGVVRVGNSITYCPVTNTDNEGEGSLRAAIDCVNDAGIGTGATAVVVFNLPDQIENLIEVKNEGFVITNQYGVSIDAGSKKIKIKSQASQLPYAFNWKVNDVELKKLSIEGFTHAVELSEGKGNRIVGNTFTQNDTAVYITSAGKNSVSDNKFYSGNLGVFVKESNVDLVANFFGETGNTLISGALLQRADNSVIGFNNFTGIKGETSGTDFMNGRALVIENAASLRINDNIYSDIDTTHTAFTLIGVKTSSIERNRFTGGLKAIEISKSEKIKIADNKFNSVHLAGIDLDSSEFVDISKNTTIDLTGIAKPININYTKENQSNKGIKIPEFTSATYRKNQVIYRGTAEPESIIEIFETDPKGFDLIKYRGDVVTDRFGNFEYAITVDPKNVNQYTLKATSTYNRYYFDDTKYSYTSEASKAFNPNLLVCFVTSESDENVEGTLRYNINLANNNECNLMLFEVPGVTQVNIEPQIDLPVITAAKLIIDATSQNGYKNKPVVTIADASSFSQAFAINSIGKVDIHGIRIQGYSNPITVTNADRIESSYSEFENFRNLGINIPSKDHKNIRLENNIYSSELADYIWYFTSPNIYAIADSLVGGKKQIVRIESDSIALLDNSFFAKGKNEGFALSAQNSDSLYVRGNKIGGFKNGASIQGISNLIFFENDFITLTDSAKMDLGIDVKDCYKGIVYSNILARTDTAIIITSSDSIECNGNYITESVYAGIYLKDSKNASVSSNQITKTPIGISIANSDSARVYGNLIYKHDSLGLVVDVHSEYVSIGSNFIGAPGTLSEITSKGAAMLIHSSNNTIGGVDSLRNTLVGNQKGGILVSKGVANKITYNIFVHNDTITTKPSHFAIRHLDNGNLLKAKPSITSSVEIVKNKKYTVKGKSEPLDSIHLYRADGHYQNAVAFAGKGQADTQGNWEVLVDTSVFERPLLLKTLSLVATATDQNNNTSQFSNILYLGTCYVNSVDDDLDNEYPVPNSFRQAVLCANQQPDKAEIRFFLDGYEGHTIYLANEMITLANDSGTSFNGKNMLPADQKTGIPTGRDTITIQTGYLPETTDTTVFWKIAGTSGSSEFKNLSVSYFDTAFVFQGTKNVQLSKMTFFGLPAYAIVIADSAENIHLDSLQHSNSVRGGLLSVKPGSKNISLKTSTVISANTAAIVESASKVTISGNTFNFLPTAMVIRGTDSLLVEENKIFGSDKTVAGIRADSTSGLFTNNTFEKFETAIGIHVTHSENFNIEKNIFKKVVNTAIYLDHVQSSYIGFNKMDTMITVGIAMQYCDSLLVEENNIAYLEKAGFDIQNSEKINLSKNLFQKKLNSDIQLINIYKEVNGKLSNVSKSEPVIEGYKVQRLDDCSKESLGIYLYGTADSLDYIQIFASDTSNTVFTEFIVDGIADSTGKWEIRIPSDKYKRELSYIYSYSATATGQVYNTSQEAVTFSFDSIVNKVVITNTADTGVGSLRSAVADINCSDIHTVVYYNIDEQVTYRIVLKDTLPIINAFRGFDMNGNTQKVYNDTLKISDDPTIFIDGAALADSLALFVLGGKCDSSSVSKLTLQNTHNALQILNSGNRFDSLNIIGNLVYSDTAIKLVGGANRITNSTISNYKRAVYIISDGNTVDRNSIANSTLNIELEGKVKDNIISKNNLVSDSITILVHGAKEANYITKNTFGSLEKPIYKAGVKLQNASYQFVTGNLMPFGETKNPISPAAYILVSDSSNYNMLYQNRIGMDDNAVVALPGNMPGILISTDVSNQPLLGNTVSKNDIAGLKAPALIIRNNYSASVSNNFFGVDSLYKQRNNEPDFRSVSGIDTSAVIIKQSQFVTFSENHLVNFHTYGIDARNSSQITIAQNRIYSEKSILKGIQLNLGTELYSNDSVMAPIIDTNSVITKDLISLTGKTLYPLAEVQIFQGFTPESQDSVSHSLRYITSIISDNNGNWIVELPSENFGFNKLNKYVAQVNRGFNSSEFSNQYTVKSLLCLLKDKKIDLIGDLYKPCPESKFEIDAQLDGLHYAWSASELSDTIRTKRAQIDTSANVTMTLKDDFGCVLEEKFKVEYKPRPETPIFLVSTNTYVSDTITLVDVTPVKLTEYDWSSTDGLTIVSSSTGSGIKGPDGKIYPDGREVRFIAPDTGTYIITQRSLRDGCFVSLDKEVYVSYKTPGQPDPYTVNPGTNNLYVYPSPFKKADGGNVYLTTTGIDPVEIQVVDLLGVEHLYWIVSGKKNYNIPIPANGLPSGQTYILKMNTGSSVLTYRFVVN